MRKSREFNWKNVTMLLLASTNLFLISNATETESESKANGIESERITELESTVYHLRNELVELDEESGMYYRLYMDAMDELYELEIELGYYNEYPINEIEMKDPNISIIERMLLENHEKGNY